MARETIIRRLHRDLFPGGFMICIILYFSGAPHSIKTLNRKTEYIHEKKPYHYRAPGIPPLRMLAKKVPPCVWKDHSTQRPDLPVRSN